MAPLWKRKGFWKDKRGFGNMEGRIHPLRNLVEDPGLKNSQIPGLGNHENPWSWKSIKGHFTHEPRAVTMKLWEPKRKCPMAIPTHLQNHVVWSHALKCSVKSYVSRPSTKCYFNERLFMWVLTHDKMEWINGCERSECHGLPMVLCLAYLQEMVLKSSPSDHET